MIFNDRYSDILLRRVSAGHICFSSTLKSFVSLTAEGAIPFNAEEFTDPSELRALTELIGELMNSASFSTTCFCKKKIQNGQAHVWQLTKVCEEVLSKVQYLKSWLVLLQDPVLVWIWNGQNQVGLQMVQNFVWKVEKTNKK